MGLTMCGYQNTPSAYGQDSRSSRIRSRSLGGSSCDLETSDDRPVILVVDSDHYRTGRSQQIAARSCNQSFRVYPLKSVASRQTRRRFSCSVLTDDIMAAMKNSISTNVSSTAATSSYIPLPMSKVLPTLYIGTYENTTDEEDLRQNGITHILTLIGNQSCVEGVNYKQYVMSDYGKTNIKDVLKEVYEFMMEGQKGNNKLLVHCQSGQNRSAVVIISFLMMNAKKTLYRAHRELRKIRPIVQVNVGYAKQLLELEKEFFGESSLPPNWMERQFDEVTEELTYKYEDLKTPDHRITMSEQAWK
jgi:protein-tyrosine phosphatase